jgi:threonylcarbamoyladenosine tRNA methylthiotransferase MtaB
MKVAIYTLGCKVNQYETQAMESELRRRGHELVDFGEKADAYIVNTCTVTAASDAKSRAYLRRAKRANPNAVVAACGCYSQMEPAALEEIGIDLVAGSGDRMAFIDLLEKEFAGRSRIVSVDSALSRRAFEPLQAGGLAARTRAMLKIEDGCVNFCAYCIIPYARGPVRSMPLGTVAGEAARLAAEGYREMVITGIEISSYGRDLGGGAGLIDALEAAAKAAPDMRIRLGSLEPRTITEEFCERAAKIKNLCPQFHLSLQSGCDETLLRMRRKYDTARYAESAALLRRRFDSPAITTDLITGFPGETEEEFSKTLAFIENIGFAAMHIFPYSEREGTPAAAMEQVDRRVREERAKRASTAAAKMHESYLASCVGKTYPVLFERGRDGVFTGHAPNYMKVRARGAGLHNTVRDVRITDSRNGVLCGELVE